jgi:hypothetical protein
MEKALGLHLEQVFPPLPGKPGKADHSAGENIFFSIKPLGIHVPHRERPVDVRPQWKLFMFRLEGIWGELFSVSIRFPPG